MKNFSNTKVVLVTTIPAQKAKPEWLIIHFCSLAKMIFVNHSFPHPRYLLEKQQPWSPLATGNIPEREAHPEVAID